MTETLWKNSWRPGKTHLSTAVAAEHSLIEEDGGQVENAGNTARNAVSALGRLIEILHEKGLLTTDEVQNVLDLYAYEVAENEQ